MTTKNTNAPMPHEHLAHLVSQQKISTLMDLGSARTLAHMSQAHIPQAYRDNVIKQFEMLRERVKSSSQLSSSKREATTAIEAAIRAIRAMPMHALSAEIDRVEALRNGGTMLGRGTDPQQGVAHSHR